MSLRGCAAASSSPTCSSVKRSWAERPIVARSGRAPRRMRAACTPPGHRPGAPRRARGRRLGQACQQLVHRDEALGRGQASSASRASTWRQRTCRRVVSSRTTGSRQMHAQRGGDLVKLGDEAAPSRNRDRAVGGTLEEYARSAAPADRPARASWYPRVPVCRGEGRIEIVTSGDERRRASTSTCSARARRGHRGGGARPAGQAAGGALHDSPGTATLRLERPRGRRVLACPQALMSPCGSNTNFFAAPWSKSL